MLTVKCGKERCPVGISHWVSALEEMVADVFLGLWFWFQRSPFLLIAERSVVVELYHGFVRPDYVFKFFPDVSHCPLNSFQLVFISQHLAVLTAMGKSTLKPS